LFRIVACNQFIEEINIDKSIDKHWQQIKTVHTADFNKREVQKNPTHATRTLRPSALCLLPPEFLLYTNLKNDCGRWKSETLIP
jgi:hypothetical protein